MGLLVFSFIMVIAVSFFCSILEAVILSVSDTYIRQLTDRGVKSGKLLESMRKEIDRPLAAILTLNTISHTLGAAVVGAQVLKLYGNEAVAIGSVILTILILVFSEIIPKTLGAIHWKSLAPLTAVTVNFLIKVLYPFVALSEIISDLIAKGRERGPLFTREELIASAELSQEEGTILNKEKIVIKNLLRLNNIFVKDIMTPRSVVVALPAVLSVDHAIEKYKPLPFSRIPIYGHDMDDIKGMVLRYELLEVYGEDGGHDKLLDDLKHDIYRISDGMSVAKALDEFIKTKEHLFLTENQAGKVTGIVTLEDTIETLLGVEIVDEYDSVEDMRQFALEQWKKRIHSRRTSKVVKSLIEELAKSEDAEREEET